MSSDRVSGDNKIPESHNKYAYAQGDPNDRWDPNGTMSMLDVSTAPSGSFNLSSAASAVAGNQLARFTIRLALAVGVAALASNAISSRDLARARNQLKNQVIAAAATASQNIVYHYSDDVAVRQIASERCINASEEFLDHPDRIARPAGAYATWIPPWAADYTQRTLARAIFAFPGTRDVSSFVAIVKDPQWRQINPVELYKPGVGCIPVQPVYFGKSLMLP